MNSKNLTWNSVRQLAIHDVNGTLRCKNYFPNVTDLTIFCHLNETNTNKLKSIIPLDRLTKLIFQSHLDDFIWIIKLLQYTPALLTLEIDDVVFKNSSLVKTKENEAFQLVSKINQIRNLIIRRYQIIHTEFLINLFPRLHQLSLPLHGDPKQLLQTLFSNKNHRLNELYLLHITNVLENDMKFMEKFIMEEKLLGQYLPEMKYNLLDKTMHVWW